MKKKIFTIAMTTVMVTGLAGCTVVVRDRPHYSSPPGHVDSVYFEYYYYPSVGVYYHFDTGYYYYFSNRRWVRTRYLPAHIRLHRDDRVRLRLKDRAPYLHYEEHRRTYKPVRRYKFDERHDRDEREFNRREYRGGEGLRRESSGGSDGGLRESTRLERRDGLKDERVEERKEKRYSKERSKKQRERDSKESRDRNREEKDKEYDKENPGRGDERRDRFEAR